MSQGDLCSCPRRFGGALTVLMAASAEGLLGVHVLADDVAPCWSESPPLCMTDEQRLLAVRSEVHMPGKKPVPSPMKE